MTGLGIIAGGGELPIAVADCAANAGRSVFIAALKGIASEDVRRFPHEWVSIGETGKTLNLFRSHDCGDILLAGRVSRPKWSDLKLDAKSLSKLPQVLAAARKGDDVLLRSVVSILESEGFRAIGVVEAAPALLANSGVLGKRKPSDEERADLELGVRVVRTLGELDVGQAAAVCNGLVLTVEAAEGTDAMIRRIGDLPENLRGTPANRRGVLVKAKKPVQDGKTDLPVIGVATIANAASVGLAGIAVEAGAAIILGKKAVADAADRAGLFVIGF